MTFWNSVGDESCQAEAPEGSLECSAFATFYPHVKTPFMVVASEWDPAVAPMMCGEGHPGRDNYRLEHPNYRLEHLGRDNYSRLEHPGR